MKVALNVNGRSWAGDVEPRLILADLLRDRLRLRGTHLGCEQGVCGACTVLLDGQPARSCLTFAFQADGHDVTTVEGLSTTGEMTRLQAEFLRRGAFQCGFCTPGFLVSAEAILRSGDRPSRDQLRELLTGNVCRCTGYAPILDAIEACLS